MSAQGKAPIDTDAARTIDSSTPPSVRDLSADALDHAVDISSTFEAGLGGRGGVSSDAYHRGSAGPGFTRDTVQPDAPGSRNLGGETVSNKLTLKSNDDAIGGQ